MKIALAQLNPIVGDLHGNSQLVLEAAQAAAEAGAELLICSELILSGYPPKDLLLREGFVNACDAKVRELASQLPSELGVLIGHPGLMGLPGKRFANAASLLHEGKVQATIHKTLLPNYDVFDEHRYFRAARNVEPMLFKGRRLGVHICEDAWWGSESTYYHEEPQLYPDPIQRLVDQGVDFLINLSASPFEKQKPNMREELVHKHVKKHNLPFLFVNQVGGNDDLVFDGRSFAMNKQGQTVAALCPFESCIEYIDIDNLGDEPVRLERQYEQELLDALVVGLRDYMHKSGFTDCVLGLSGGIDSALAAYIAAKALGPKHVHGILMPSRYSSDHSVDDALKLAEAIGIDHETIPIDAVHNAYEGLSIISDDLAGEAGGLADQNLQARIRGAIVMLRSNRHGWIALATGNKSELAIGYCTIYGDMAGGFAVLCDLFKEDVYGLSRYINETCEKREVIPDNIITKPPSAELAPDQFDQDTLPPYPVLDAILTGLIEQEKSFSALCEEFPAETVQWVINRLDRNEFKRRQMPPGIKLSQRAFGSGRRMPIVARYPQT
ncbi:Glutamine-dependent NAD(+) synthetase [Polystyrenella longa]|uniref:Glutamine-dependent NAD(+) synthetase n=1 Tax=Polystyrenella longa TaxID=2528007 RepID=A0A518CRM0_9PLAN|nr:NAD+ synthase [Polystyrenella longa]QDU81858.1 Glutamine-dependent NAD(+) synthetase [Polystyrenella longa]